MIATRQLVALGLSRAAVEKRVRAGRLTPYIRGVYLVGPILPPLGPESAAQLAMPDAVLSHLSAAALWGIAGRPDVVHILAVTQKRHRKGIVTHRGALPPTDIRERQGLSLTSPYRTILDLRGNVSAKTLKHAIWEAAYRRLITDDQADELLGKRTRRLATHDAERLLVELVTNAGLPEPETNVRLHNWEIDLYWPDHRVAPHLEAGGIHVRRASGLQLTDEPMTIVATVAGALARR